MPTVPELIVTDIKATLLGLPASIPVPLFVDWITANHLPDAWWGFNDDNATIVDRSGHGINGAYAQNGAAQFEMPSLYPNSASGTGFRSSVTFSNTAANFPSIILPATFTVLGFVDAVTGYNVGSGVIYENDAASFRVQLDAGTLRVYVDGDPITASAVITPGKHMWAVKYGGGSYSIWVDGVMVASQAYIAPPGPAFNAGSVGRNRLTNADFVTAGIQDIMIIPGVAIDLADAYIRAQAAPPPPFSPLFKSAGVFDDLDSFANFGGASMAEGVAVLGIIPGAIVRGRGEASGDAYAERMPLEIAWAYGVKRLPGQDEQAALFAMWSYAQRIRAGLLADKSRGGNAGMTFFDSVYVNGTDADGAARIIDRNTDQAVYTAALPVVVGWMISD